MVKFKLNKKVMYGIAIRLLIVFILGLFLFYLEPKEVNHYLDEDVRQLKKNDYLNFSLILSSLIIIGFTSKAIIKREKVDDIIKTFFGSALLCFWIFVLFKTIFMTSFLFINRQFKEESIIKTYKIAIISDKNVTGLNVDKGNNLINENTLKVIPNYDSSYPLSMGDTIRVQFYKGIFGVNYLAK